MVYAQIKDSLVSNTITLSDESLIDLFSEGFDFIIRVDNISPRPSIGWSYDSVSNKFSFNDTSQTDLVYKQGEHNRIIAILKYKAYLLDNINEDNFFQFITDFESVEHSYINGNIKIFIDSINIYSEIFITQEIKEQLILILNI